MEWLLLWGSQEDFTEQGRHLSWTFREGTRFLLVQVMWKLSENSEEDRSLGTVRTERNSWGFMARGPYPSYFVTRMPGSPFTVFFFVVPWIHHHESLQLLFAWRQVLLMRNPSFLLPGIPGCGCLHPLLSSSQKHHHKFCICVIYWADFFRTRPEDIWAVPL